MLPKILEKIISTAAPDRDFQEAKISGWLLWLSQNFVRLDLALHNRLVIAPADLEILKNLPSPAGIILTPNHTDETDLKICVELSRLSGRDFYYMANREAFDECFGIAGWWFRRVGAFSVDRGGEKDSLEESKRYAVDIVKQGLDILVIFPEGEITYLNDIIQPLKSGAVAIGLRAVAEARQSRANWTAYLVPMAIKYRYEKSIKRRLESRIQKIEKSLDTQVRVQKLQARLGLIVRELLRRQEISYKLEAGSARLTDLSKRVQEVREAVLQQLEEKYLDEPAGPSGAGITERSWKLSSYLRGLSKGLFSAESLAQMEKDLSALSLISHMQGWQPEYVELNPSQERLAETVIKLEREVYKINRPHQLAKREVVVRIGEPIDLSPFIGDYQGDPHRTRHLIAERLRDILQSLLDRADKSE